ncbi:MAG TPA: MoxR family ATPase, partial [Nonomuraea sp.]|nr:MoxR family ATPase [Nonomuraea sp.]
LLHLRAVEASHAEVHEDELYSERFLVRRPLLRAVDYRSDVPPVLLVDEVDRADDEFEAFLLEILSDYTITVPELTTFHAEVPPVVVLTSNRTRDLHDALKRRCLYHWLEHPTFDREVAILLRRLPDCTETLAMQVARAAERLRQAGLVKPPGVAETLDWTEALLTLGARELDPGLAAATLGAALKYREDVATVLGNGLLPHA